MLVNEEDMGYIVCCSSFNGNQDILDNSHLGNLHSTKLMSQ